MGMVGADLKAVTQKAAYLALRRPHRCPSPARRLIVGTTGNRKNPASESGGIPSPSKLYLRQRPGTDDALGGGG